MENVAVVFVFTQTIQNGICFSNFQIKYKTEFEPYVFADKTVLPDYDVRYVGRYLNKLSHFCSINRKK